ncbi:hypothetical protein [Thiobacillus sp.]
MKALLINPETRSIEVIDITSHADLASLIGKMRDHLLAALALLGAGLEGVTLEMPE